MSTAIRKLFSLDAFFLLYPISLIDRRLIDISTCPTVPWDRTDFPHQKLPFKLGNSVAKWKYFIMLIDSNSICNQTTMLGFGCI